MPVDHKAAVGTLLQDARELFGDGRYAESLAVLAEARAYVEKHLPDPSVASAYRTHIYRDSGDAAYFLGRYNDAATLHRQALEEVPGYDPRLRPFIVTTLWRLLCSATAAEDWAAAEEAFEALRDLPPEAPHKEDDAPLAPLPGTRMH